MALEIISGGARSRLRGRGGRSGGGGCRGGGTRPGSGRGRRRFGGYVNVRGAILLRIGWNRKNGGHQGGDRKDLRNQKDADRNQAAGAGCGSRFPSRDRAFVDKKADQEPQERSSDTGCEPPGAGDKLDLIPEAMMGLCDDFDGFLCEDRLGYEQKW